MDDQHAFAQLPSVNEVVDVVAPHAGVPRALVVLRARRVLQTHRTRLKTSAESCPGRDALTAAIAAEVAGSLGPGLRRVINATGVVLHTGLGRAPLSDDAIGALVDVARFANVQADLDEGVRSLREAHIEELVCHLTGCEAATVVNNNAAATLLTLAAVAAGREVIVSRGELVEIGGSFRIPEVMAQSGAVLVEVGCTNRTHLRDYERAITERTAAILKVHTSNYAVQGFVSSVGLAELSGLAKARGLVLIHDMGSGSLIDLAQWGLAGEPPASTSIEQGADLVTFSGDKLVGGPQAGIILGAAALIARIRAHPLARAVRVDKLCLAALEATLRQMADPSEAVLRIPTLRMITMSAGEVAKRATRLARRWRRCGTWPCAVVGGSSSVGSGAFPVVPIPTALVEIDPRPRSARDVARDLRFCRPAVFVRVGRDRLLVDLRTVFPEEEKELTAALLAVAATSPTRAVPQ